MMSTELELATQLAAGAFRGPVSLGASWLVVVRITGSGVAWRQAHEEFCWRSPAVWSTPKMARRCAGLAVLVGHPAEGVVSNLEDFQTRCVGVVLLAFARGEDLMAVARIFDQELAVAVAEGRVSTSPSCTFSPGATASITLPSGETLVVEGEPALLDHLALVREGGGVWDRHRGDDNA